MTRKSGRLRKPNRYAFTLVELLVVIAIIGVLVALLLPAVQMAREAARRSSCSNKLKQLALACHNYSDANRHLPMGNLGPERESASLYTNQQAVGFICHILPFIEQNAIYDGVSSNIKLGPGTNDQLWWYGGTTRPLREFANARIDTVLCPSDDPYANTSLTLTLVNPRPGGVSGWGIGVTGGNELVGRTNYLGVGGYLGSGDYAREGIMVSRTVHRFADITDGTSNVLMLGEALGSGNNRVYSHAWMGAGGLPAAWGLDSAPNYYNFSSKHPGVVQFALADGSVQSLSETLDFNTYVYLSGMRDGRVVGDY